MLLAFTFLGITVFILIMILFLIFPAIRKHPDRKILKDLYIAHRGLHNNNSGIPENSLKAFEQAIEKGFAIENDIHLTADGEVVVFHDDSLLRMCGVDKIIEEMTLDEIKKLPLAGTDQFIPTLKECLEVIKGRVPLLIEFKCQSIINCEALCTAANNILKDYKGKYFVQSFYPMVLKWYKKNRPDICRGQLASDFKGEAIYKRMLGNMLFNFWGRPDFVSYDYLAKGKPMRRLVTRLGALPVGWTFTDQKAIADCKKDFKTYIFEDCEILVE